MENHMKKLEQCIRIALSVAGNNAHIELELLNDDQGFEATAVVCDSDDGLGENIACATGDSVEEAINALHVELHKMGTKMCETLTDALT